MERREKYRLSERRAIVTIISGILVIVITMGSIGISLVSWKNYQDYQTSTLIKQDIEQDGRIAKVESALNYDREQLSAMNAKIDYMIKLLDKRMK